MPIASVSLAAIIPLGVAVVGLLGLYLRSHQETVRLREQIAENHLQHRMVVYHNVLSLASKIELMVKAQNSVYGGEAGWKINEQFKHEVDGLAVFAAAEARKHALAMRSLVDRHMGDSDKSWIDQFAAEKQAFMDATHADVGPSSSQ
jgi:hypothetical protein